MERGRLPNVSGAIAAVVFVGQFAALDAILRGPRALFDAPRAALSVLASVLAWTALLVVARARGPRVTAALVAATLVVVQVFVFRYYRTPLDVQVATSALHAWRDAEPVVARAAPYVAVAIAGVFVVEMALLHFAHHGGALLRSRRARAGVAATAAISLFFVSPRDATPDIRGVHALSAFGRARASGAVTSRAEPLPPIHSEREELPSILFVLTESVRAADYVESGEGATARHTAAALGTAARVSLRQMRSVSSYTALSISALLTGRSQEAPRAEILRSPSLFDFAHSALEARGRKAKVAYYGSQSADVFEAKDVHRSVDVFVTVEDLLGREVGDESTLDGLPLDRQIVDRFVTDLPHLEAGSFVVLHLWGTHAPYYFEDDKAEFAPFDRVVTWSTMAGLRNAYKSAIAEQDRQVSRAVRAFIDRNAERPWMVLFTSDHGEAFGEHGAIHHGQNLFDEQVHVPAWIAFSSGALDSDQARALYEHERRFVTHLDVLPTLLDALGIWENLAVRPARRAMSGHSLLRPWQPRSAIPVTNCTEMFPCPLETWGMLGAEHK
ncbi:MAG TPA: sulfatase-like hydrolase/transferase, partial [Labilithrix sp.]|nr:sulfatase-like hydrolase/transferase [Labilithrix sp.]